MLNRRDFARLSLASIATAGVAPAILPANRQASGDAGRIAGATQKQIKPKRLASGDTVGLVLPASAELTADDIAFARDQLTAIGFNVILGAHVYDRWGYLAGHDRDRADDINKMFAEIGRTRLNSSHGYISYAVFCLKK